MRINHCVNKPRKQESEIEFIISTVVHFSVYKIKSFVSRSTMGGDTDAHNKLCKENLLMMTP